MEKPRALKRCLLSLMAGFKDNEADEADITQDIELVAHLTAVAELETMKRSGLPFTLH